MTDYKLIEEKAHDLLSKYKLDLSAPVNLNRLLDHLSIEVENRELDGEISGLLVVREGKGYIGLDSSQSKQRKNFTIAHEIGHFILHRNNKKTFVDESIGVFARSSESNFIEREANAFAASLLMPKSLIKKQLELRRVDPFNISDEQIRILASDFKVSGIAMTYRLANLGYINL